jgi:polysaccharide biosynthesis transport protein
MAGQGVELREYLGVLWSRKWWVIGILGLVVASALFYSWRQTPLYDSSAQVLDEPIGFFAGSPPGPGEFVDMLTEQQIASAQSVITLANRKAREAGVIPGTLSVSVPSSTETLLFTGTSPSPVAARVTAQAYAEAYLERRLAQAQAQQRVAMRPYQEELARINADLASIQTKLAGHPTLDERTQLNIQQNNLFSRQSTVQQQLNSLIPPAHLRVGELIQPALLPGSPSSPDLRKNIALALLAGLFLGVGAAVLRDRTDQRIRDRVNVEREIGAPVLAMVPRVRMRQSATHRELITLTNPNSLAAEAHKQLRTSLLVSAAERGFKTILVTSASAEEGKTATVANLGVALAQAGKRTVVVSADLRRPTLHLYFGTRARPGLAEVLTDQASVRDALQPTHVTSNLYIIPCREVSGSSELLGSDRMKRVLWKLQEEADFVLVDAPPLLGISDALTLVPAADSILLVVRVNATSRGALREARHQLEQVDARVMGAVLTSVDPSAHPYGSSYYHYSQRRVTEEPEPTAPVVRPELHGLPVEP